MKYILIFFFASMVCEAQDLKKYNQRKTGKKIQLLGTTVMIASLFDYPKYSPIPGAGILGIGMTLEIGSNKKKNKRKI